MKYPIVLIKARDWKVDSGTYYPTEIKFVPAIGWAVGFLFNETETEISIAFEHFEDGGTFRHIQTYPKETILIKKIIGKLP